MDTLGDRIRVFRTFRKLTQSELAKGICSASAISQIETNKISPSTETLTLIAERLKFPVERLIYGQDFTNANEKVVYAIILMEQKRFNEAIDLFESVKSSPVFELLPTSGHTIYNLSICLIEERRFDEAISLLEGLTQSHVQDGVFSEDILMADTYSALSIAYEERAMLKMRS